MDTNLETSFTALHTMAEVFRREGNEFEDYLFRELTGLTDVLTGGTQLTRDWFLARNRHGGVSNAKFCRLILADPSYTRYDYGFTFCNRVLFESVRRPSLAVEAHVGLEGF